MAEIKHVYEVRPRKDKRVVDLISMRCDSVGCGMTRQITQSGTQCTAAVHSMR